MLYEIVMILYFALMPIVYKNAHKTCAEGFFTKRDKGYKQVHIGLLVFYYALEAIFLLNIFLKTGKNPFSNFLCLMFVICSLVFILMHLIFVSLCSPCFTDYPVVHAIPLLILFLIFINMFKNSVNYEEDYAYFNEMEYNFEMVDTLSLEILTDTYRVSGDVSGGLFYISGSMSDNYTINYAYLNEDGILIPRNIPYDEKTVELHPEENCTNPRIEFYNCHKEYKGFEDSYTAYKIYFPMEYLGVIRVDLE